MHRTDLSRFSTADLLLPYLNDPRLAIVSSCEVNKINIENSSAKSVECKLQGKQESFTCNEAIVCSAGTFASPLILQESGIGPKGAFADLPGVGNNLRDHFSIDLIYEPHNYKNDVPLEKEVENLSRAKYLFTHDMPYVLQGRLILYI